MNLVGTHFDSSEHYLESVIIALGYGGSIILSVSVSVSYETGLESLIF